MSNNKFLKDHQLNPPASWQDLLQPAYKGMIQIADARTSGTAVTRIFSALQIFGRDEAKAFHFMKKLRRNVQVYTKSGGGGTIPVGLGQACPGVFFIVDALKTKQEGYDVAISFPKERTIGENFGVKAAGGIRTLSAALKMIEAGANRLGTSGSVAITKQINNP